MGLLLFLKDVSGTPIFKILVRTLVTPYDRFDYIYALLTFFAKSGQTAAILALDQNCTTRQCSPLRRKFMECSINNPALSLLMKHLVIGQRQKALNFSAFHWSPHGSLVSTGQHFVTTRVVHLPKRTETSLITKSDHGGPNHQLLQLCTACTAWSDSDQAVRAVHSCSS